MFYNTYQVTNSPIAFCQIYQQSKSGVPFERAVSVALGGISDEAAWAAFVSGKLESDAGLMRPKKKGSASDGQTLKPKSPASGGQASIEQLPMRIGEIPQLQLLSSAGAPGGAGAANPQPAAYSSTSTGQAVSIDLSLTKSFRDADAQDLQEYQNWKAEGGAANENISKNFRDADNANLKAYNDAQANNSGTAETAGSREPRTLAEAARILDLANGKAFTLEKIYGILGLGNNPGRSGLDSAEEEPKNGIADSRGEPTNIGFRQAEAKSLQDYESWKSNSTSANQNVAASFREADMQNQQAYLNSCYFRINSLLSKNEWTREDKVQAADILDEFNRKPWQGLMAALTGDSGQHPGYALNPKTSRTVLDLYNKLDQRYRVEETASKPQSNEFHTFGGGSSRGGGAGSVGGSYRYGMVSNVILSHRVTVLHSIQRDFAPLNI